MRTVWVSFDTIGRDCLEAAAEIVFEQGYRIDGHVVRGGRPVTEMTVSVALADLNGDNKPEVLITAYDGMSVLPNLGDGRLGSAASYRSLFRYYERHILASNLDCVEEIKAIAARYSRVALACFEADYHACHRHRITEYLSQDPSFRGEIHHLQ